MVNRKFSFGNVFVQYGFLFLFFFSPTVNFAQLLAEYKFDGVSTKDKRFDEVTTQPENATFSTFSFTEAQWAPGDNVFNTRNWTSPTQTKEAYIEFTVTAKPGAYLNLTHLSFRQYRTTSGPAKVKITHNATGTFTEALNFEPVISSYRAVNWDFPDIITPLGGSVTFRLYGTESSQSLGAFRIDDLAIFGSANKLRVNEFHYANTGTSKTGFIEILASKDLIPAKEVTVSLYNSAGEVYGTFPLSTFKFDEKGVYDDYKIYYLDIPGGLEESKGGFSLSIGDKLIQFLSYGGIIQATAGPAAGVASQDVGITESTENGANNSIFLADVDADAAPIWTKGTTNSNTKGFANWDLNQTLPVSLLYFKGQNGTKGVNLLWVTASEKDNEQFLVERSSFVTDNFKTIAKIKGAGTTQQEQQYRFTDERPLNGTTYYRLKQIDFDGTTTYSPIIAIEAKHQELQLSVYPNPVSDQINIDLGNQIDKEAGQIQVVNSTGRIVYQEDLKAMPTYQVPVANLPSGTYYLLVIRNGKKESKTFIKI